MTKRRTRIRADLLVVQRGLAETRERAQALIIGGAVLVPGGKVLKPGSLLSPDTVLETKGGLPYVGRGGVKLAHALDAFSVAVDGKTALDVGASTGGFTDCLLQRGARRVFALDVGHGQMDYRLRRDPRVVVMEKVNARYSFSLPAEGSLTNEGSLLDEGSTGDVKVDLATVDVAFISLTKVLPQVALHVKPGCPLIALVKPQFEAERGEVGRGGVVKDPKVHARVLGRMVLWAVEEGFRLGGIVPSPILGDAGNREFFVLMRTWARLSPAGCREYY
ncbi:MAG: TlyA family RNA methyltransferase [Dehalococcoidia bacterium]|nr:TlyA family RNA methyltransferase [Dehalococcoidia bacterium]